MKRRIVTIRIVAALVLTALSLSPATAVRAGDGSDSCIVHRSDNSSFRLCQSGFRNESYNDYAPYQYSRSIAFVPVKSDPPRHGVHHNGYLCKGGSHGRQLDRDRDRDSGRLYRHEERREVVYYVFSPPPAPVSRRVVIWP